MITNKSIAVYTKIKRKVAKVQETQRVGMVCFLKGFKTSSLRVKNTVEECYKIDHKTPFAFLCTFAPLR